MPLINSDTQEIRSAVDKLKLVTNNISAVQAKGITSVELAGTLIKLQADSLHGVYALVEGLLNSLDNVTNIANRLQHTLDTNNVIREDRHFEN